MKQLEKNAKVCLIGLVVTFVLLILILGSGCQDVKDQGFDPNPPQPYVSDPCLGSHTGYVFPTLK